MAVERTRETPLYVQVREELRQRIEAGVYPAWEALPAVDELAAHYGVGRITVIHALRDLAQEGLVTRIQRKGTFATPSVPSRSRTLAFIVPDIEDLFVCEIHRGLAAAARRSGCRVSVYSSERDAALEAEHIRALVRGREDGATIFPTWGRANAAAIAELKESGFPFVLVNRFFRDIPTDWVVTDNRAGAECAVEHLIGLGHRRIGCLGWLMSTAIEDRLAGYRRALERHGIAYDETLVASIMDAGPERGSGYEPSSGGYDEMKRLLAMPSPPTAVFAVSDRLAVGALRALGEAGKTVPEDMALVGFDNVRYAADLGLTTMAQPAQETGEMAARILLGRIEGQNMAVAGEYRQVVLPARLMVRRTCGGWTSTGE